MLLPRSLLVCALVVSFRSSSLSQYVCPTNTVNATNGNITFDPLPAGNQLRTTAEYNPGGLALWYNLASGVIDAARPGGLPYGNLSITDARLTETINTVLQPFYPTLIGGQSNVTLSNPFNDVVNTIVQPLGSYFAGLIALTVIGGLIAFCLPVCGCCFCCCRLCGFCGGKLKQKDTKYNDCLTWTFTILLILFTCGLSVGVIFSFLSNQQVFDSLRNFQSTADNALSDVDTFINNTLDEVEFLFCQFNDTVDVGFQGVQNGVDEALGTVDSFSGGVNNVVNNVISLSQNINSTLEELRSIQNDVNTLNVTLVQLQGNLTEIANQLETLQTTCTDANIPMFTCPNLNADMFRTAVNIDLSQVPDVNDVMQNVESVLQGQNIADLARQGNETFNSLVNNLRTQVSDAINQIRSNSSQFSTAVDQIRSRITPILGQINSVDALDNARRTVNDAFQLISPYDTARYALGIVICSLAAVVVVVIFIGVLCGAIGFRRNREPDDRTALSNCGGITLLFAVALAFIFGFLLLLLSALTFFAGGIMQKSCQSIEPPQVELLAETIDNPNNTGGQYILGRLIFQNGSVPITISGILRNCNGNASVYQALMLNRLLDIQQLRSSVSDQIPNVEGDLSSLTSGFTFDTNSILPDDLRMRLTNFSDSGVANINFTSYQDQVNRALLNVDLQAQIDLLTNLSNTADSLRTSSTPESQNATLLNISTTSTDIISTIQTINSSLANIMDQVSMLGVSADQLSGSSNSFTDAANNAINSADQLVQQVNGPDGIEKINQTLSMTYSEVLGNVNSYLDHVVFTIEMQLGNCNAVSVIYTGTYNSLCRFALDGLNGFWLALGWCGIFFLPVIIFAILAQQYYRRMKVDEEFPHDDSFPLKTY